MITYEVTSSHFDYSILSKEHLSTTFYSLLVLCFISFYWIKEEFARISIFIVIMALGIYIKRIEWFALPYFIALAGFIYYALNANKPVIRGWAFVGALAICVYTMLYSIPWLHNWPIAKNFILSHNTRPYNLTLRMEIFCIGLFYVWFCANSLMNQKGAWRPIVTKSFIAWFFTILFLIPIAAYFKYAQIDLKPTNFFWLWALYNLFFICTAEEAIFRGFIQSFLQLRLQNVQGGKYLAVFVGAGLFAVSHFKGGYVLMGLSGIAGLFYGWAYLQTKRIEASILAHFAVNATHFLCFSYPALTASLK